MKTGSKKNVATIKPSPIAIIFFLVLLLSCIVSVAYADPAVFPVTLTDDKGNSITIQQQPARIVSLAPSNTEIAYAIGAGSRIVGVTDFCDYPPDTVHVPKIGGFSTVDIEKVVSMSPDLVLASNLTGIEVLDRLSSYGIPCLVLQPESMEDIFHNINIIGQATGNTEKADALVSDLQKRVEQVSEQAQTLPSSPTVIHVIWKDPLTLSGSDTFQDTLIQLAGGTQAFPNVQSWGTVSLEEFVTADPDIILVNSGDGMAGTEDTMYELYDYFMTKPRLSGLSAVKNDNVVEVQSDLIDRAGPRSVEALEKIAMELQRLSVPGQ